jgi:hypothetical protein
MVETLIDERLSKEEIEAERFDDVGEDSGETVSEQEFRNSALRIIIQRNDFLLPNLIDMLRTHRTLEVSPYYQRRARWDLSRKSKLIESFLVNIPVPPVFLYENEFARYEVMDGQQRVSAILEFFENQFALRGLEILNSLHGMRFHQLPREVRAGLERRSLPAIILLKESTPSHESAVQLRRYVFERLNTGGVRLNAQEVRNSVYAGPFNDLLLELSRHSLFTSMWDIPPVEPHEASEPSARLRRNSLYRQMRDVELVLRVFALLDPRNVGKGMRSTLDSAMGKYSNVPDSELRQFRAQFLGALELAYKMGGNDVFRLPAPRSGRGRPSASLYDGIMVALMRNLDKSGRISVFAEQVNQLIRAELENHDFWELVTGRANTREATLNRSLYIERLIESAISDS